MVMTRAERRRLEKLTGNKPVVYQYTAAQIEEIKRQAVQAQKEKLKKILTEENDRRSKLLQFSEAVVAEVNRICGDDYADIRVYSQETYEKCGVKYELQDDAGGDAVG